MTSNCVETTGELVTSALVPVTSGGGGTSGELVTSVRGDLFGELETSFGEKTSGDIHPRDNF